MKLTNSKMQLLLLITLMALSSAAATAFSTQTETFDITKSDRIGYRTLNSTPDRTWTNLQNAFDDFPTTTYTNTSNNIGSLTPGILIVNHTSPKNYYYLLNYTYTGQTTNIINGGSITYRFYASCPTAVAYDTFATAYALTTRSGTINNFCLETYYYVLPTNTQISSSDYTRLYDYEVWAYEDGITINVTDIDSNLLDNFTITLYDENQTLIESGYTNTNVAWFNMSDKDINLNYTLKFNKSGYFNVNHTFNYTRNHTLGNLYDYTLTTLKVPVISVNFYDEVTEQTINNVSYKLIFDTIATEGNTTTGSVSNIYLNATGLMEIEYISTSYPVRHYYLDVESQTNTSLDLYLLNENNATATSYLITNQAGVPLTNATLSVLRRYIEDGTPQYKVVEMAKSNNQGEGGIYLQQVTAMYQFMVTYQGETIAITNPSQIFNNNIVIRGNVGEDVTQILYDLNNITYSGNYENYNFTITWSDNIGTLEQICIDIYRLRAGEKTRINNSCSSSLTGTIIIGVDNETSATYEGVVYATTTTSSNSVIIDTINAKVDDVFANIGVQGIFFTAIFVVVTAFVAIGISPVAAILLSVFGLIMSAFLGFLSISTGTIFLISAAGGVLLYAFRRGGG